MRAQSRDEIAPLPDAIIPSAGSVSEEPINILIVDDEPKNLTVLETILDAPGYRLVKAESADQALLALLAKQFALIILDIRMPGTTGLELAQMIKARKKSALIPIIFLTAYYNEDQHVLEGYGTGAVDYLQKPVNSAILRSKVAVFAELHRKQREIEVSNHALQREIVSRQRVEEQLRELNATLEQQVAERTQEIQVLLNEVNHRSKNILSLVLAIAKQTADPTEDFVQRFTCRVQALSTHQDLLLSSQWRSIDLLALIRAQLAHFEDLVGERIILSGPPLKIAASAVQSVGMALHELATNAVKHGSLSDQKGKVDISWKVVGGAGNDRRFLMHWRESGGPPARVPARRGFGSKVIRNMIELSLDGEVQLEFASSGLIWQLACPVARICDEGLAKRHREVRKAGQ